MSSRLDFKNPSHNVPVEWDRNANRLQKNHSRKIGQTCPPKWRRWLSAVLSSMQLQSVHSAALSKSNWIEETLSRLPPNSVPSANIQQNSWRLRGSSLTIIRNSRGLPFEAAASSEMTLEMRNWTNDLLGNSGPSRPLSIFYKHAPWWHLWLCTRTPYAIVMRQIGLSFEASAGTPFMRITANLSQEITTWEIRKTEWQETMWWLEL